MIHASGFPGGSVVKNPPVKAGDMSLISGPGGYTSQSKETQEPQPWSLGSRARAPQQAEPRATRVSLTSTTREELCSNKTQTN